MDNSVSLRLLKGKRLNKVFYESFYLENKLIIKYNLFYLKFEIWYFFTLSEGKLVFNKANTIPQLGKRNGDDFIYGIIEEYDLESSIINKKLLGVSLLKFQESIDEIYGVIFYFDKNILILYNGINCDEGIFVTQCKNDIPEDLIESSI